MSIHMLISCPHCQRDIEASHEHSGAVVNCPHEGCGQPFEMPEIPQPKLGIPHEDLALGSAERPTTPTANPKPAQQGQVRLVRRANTGLNYGRSRTSRDSEPQLPSQEIGTLKAMVIGMWHFGLAYVKTWLGALINIWPFIVGLSFNDLNRVGDHALAGVAKSISGFALSPWAAVGLGAFLILGMIFGPGAAREQSTKH